MIQYQGRIASSCQPSARSASERRGRRHRPGRHPQQRQADQAHEEGGGVGGEQPAGPEDRDEHAARGRAADAEEALREPEQAVGLLQLGGRHGLGDQRHRGRAEERRRRPVEGRADAELPDVRVPGQQQDRQRRLHRAAHRVGRQHHVLPSQPVRPHPSGQHERDPGDGRDGRDDADVGGGAADVQDREDQRDLHHRVADGGGGGAHPHQPVGTARERLERRRESRARLRLGGRRFGH